MVTERINQKRRTFLKISATGGGGLIIEFLLPSNRRLRASESLADNRFEPNAWLRIHRNNNVSIRVASSEMGQGVMTAIPMLIAEELDADWSRVSVEQAPAHNAYYNPFFGAQATGGSTAVRAYWTPVREAGAVARDMLVSAAAKIWGVGKDSCYTELGEVVNDQTGRRLSYGELTEMAATLPIPDVVFVKEPDEFKLIGKPMPRVDTPSKTNGSAIFGQDVRVSGMLTALVIRCPILGGKLKSFDAGESRKVKGVCHVMQIPTGVAVVADGFWAAQRGRDVLKVTWDKGSNADLNSAGITQRYQAAVNKSGVEAHNVGDVDRAFTQASKRLGADYEVPYLAHACMEPMNCTAHVRDDGCDIWVPTQAQTRTQKTAEKLTGLPAANINVHTTFLGGGFGRRSEQDFIIDAISISKAVGVPVKVLWTREDDMQHDFYRPATYNRLEASIDGQGRLTGWRHVIAGPSIFSRVLPNRISGGIDPTSIEGAANLPYEILNVHVTYTMVNPGVPVGFWRSVGSSQNAYVTECFLDEVAAAGNRDPYELRLQLLDDHSRHKGVLQRAADAAGWGNPLPEGHYRGIAVAESFGSFVAQVAEISLTDRGDVKIHRVVCAVDCGLFVNPDTIEAQMQSGIVYGLSAALMGEITIESGRVKQHNFHDYPVMRMDEMPQIEVHIIPSNEAPGGIGEPGTPPIAPAVANAVFAATGRPVRRLPIRTMRLRKA